MRRRIVVLVTLALVMAAVMASSALPAWAVPISEMSCAQIGEAAEDASLEYANAVLSGDDQRAANLEARLEALEQAAQRKGCGPSGGGGPEVSIRTV